MRSADIRLVVGTRPEAIKLAPLAHALVRAGAQPSLLITGQHPGLNQADFGLGSFRSQHLGCPGKTDPMAHVRAVTRAATQAFRQRPDLVVVQGDTSSAFGAARAGFAAGVPVAHVEAGLRSHDPQLPWPEEDYRVRIDRQAQLLFAPTHGSAANLRCERVPGRIHVTGNTGVDALLAFEHRLAARRLNERAEPIVLVTCHRRESWRDGLHSIAEALVQLARSGQCLIRFIVHPNPAVRAAMESALAGHEGIELIEPCSHFELLQRLRDSDLVLSDSGGIQEEAPTLGVPLLVLREKTERPEGIESGNCRLVGTSTERIVTETQRLLQNPGELAAMSRRALPYGDGRAAPRIAAIIKDWLAS